MMEKKDNETVQQSLTRLIVEEITGQPFNEVKVTVGPLVTNYFSFVFFIETYTGRNKQRVFVKIPKEDLRQRSKSILPITTTDRRMAWDEELSLRMLGEHWQSDDLDVFWIRLRGVFPQYNAVVTDATQGDDALAVFRRLDMNRRFGLNKDCIRLREAMARLGTALGRFHQRNAQNIVFRLNETMLKLEEYCHKIESSIRSPWTKNVIQVLDPFSDTEIETLEVTTLKGIDIRNIQIDKQNKLFLLDPGRMKRTCREADLARFIMTYRILYWGSGLFFLRLMPDLQAEAAFLKAYYLNSDPPSPKLLSIYLVKEQLKHWHTAIDSLWRLSWPIPIKRLVEATYVNPFYKRQIEIELKKVF
ncbi:MAG: hypothetical protein ABIJ37_02400 [Pseudomonadota bacterium]